MRWELWGYKVLVISLLLFINLYVTFGCCLLFYVTQYYCITQYYAITMGCSSVYLTYLSMNRLPYVRKTPMVFSKLKFLSTTRICMNILNKLILCSWLYNSHPLCNLAIITGPKHYTIIEHEVEHYCFVATHYDICGDTLTVNKHDENSLNTSDIW